MEVSVLSKGRTLTDTWPHTGVGAVTIAINQAIVAAPSVDWLCMMDVHLLKDRNIRPAIQPMIGLSPRMGVVTADPYIPVAQEIWPDRLIVGARSLKPVGHHRIPNTACAALFFAAQTLKADVIHLHGFDLGGTNFMGEEETMERGERRWKDEREILTKVCKALRDLGCVIHSHGAFKV
jgi:hypothetical protein